MTERPSSITEDLNSGLDADQGPPVLSVGEISNRLKRTVEESFSEVRVRGEITGFKRAPSGHLYFRLKDEDAVLDGVCWRGTAGKLAMDPEDGMEVIARGRVTIYQARSTYQIVVDDMELAGEGALLKLLEQRKKKLAAEGLFDSEAKQEIPFLPAVIGIVTSPTGAVIRDILHRLEDRFPLHVLLWPVQVQGAEAAGQITAAIKGFNKIKTKDGVPRPDVLIVARGGGSLEDLMAFNEENVVRAAANSKIPLISAVGHETDWTLIDLAADRRAPTPTAAAEMAVPVRTDLLALVEDDGARLISALNRVVDEGRLRLQGLARGLPDLARLTGDFMQRLDDWTERLANTGNAIVRERRQALKQVSALLESYAYERVLERGFALVADDAGAPVVTVKELTPGLGVTLQFHDGKAGAIVDTVPGKGGLKKKKKPKPRSGSGGDGRQGTLL